ncbi:MAG: Yip1 family protein [Niabella sp.]
MTSLIDRVKNILTNPKAEWEVINNEPATLQGLLTSYVIPLSLLSALASFLKFFVFSSAFGIAYSIAYTIFAIVVTVLVFVIATYVIDALAPNFKSEKDINKSAQLVAYSGTAGYVAGIFSFIPVLGGLLSLAGAVYSIYLFYLGVGPLKKTPEDQKVIYIVVYILISWVIYMVLFSVVAGLLFSSLMTGAAAVSVFG